MKKMFILLFALFLGVTMFAQQAPRAISNGELLSIAFAQSDPITRAPGDVVYTEGFETTTGTALPAGWTVSHAGTADSWISLGLNLIYGTPPEIGNIPGVTGLVPTHSGNRMMGLSWNQTGRNAWAISSGIALTAGKWYSVSFWLMMPGYGAERSGLECRIGQSNTADGLSTASLIYKNTTQTVVGWTKVSGVFQAPTTGNYYLGFHDLTASQEGIYTTIDDIEIVEADPASIVMNDLSISGANPLIPFTKVPASQVAGLLVAGNMPFPNKFVAQVSNVGAATQTNVSFSANLEGTNLGTPATVASILPNVTETMTLNSSQGMYYPYMAGNHNIEYNVTQTETEENPADNTATFTLEIGNKYQMDAITDYALTGVGSNTATLTLGNIFTITNNTTLTDIEIGFLNNPAIAGINYTVSLYRMSNATTTLAHTFTTANQPRPASGTVTVTVPSTALTPGQYYVAVNQITTTNIGVSYDTRPESNRCYTKTYSATGAAGAVTMQPSFGALAIRMITSGGTTPTAYYIIATPNNAAWGEVTGGGVFFSGNPVTLLAKQKFGCEFVKWSDNTTANPYPTFNASADFSITAIFQEKNLCEDKIVGTGTNTVNYSPINTFWGYTYSQQIYTAADIGKTGEIKSIAFEYINTTPYNANNVTIYMGVTNKSSFTNAQDLVPVSELQQVFSGSVPFSNANKWSTINLNIPFPYTCGNLVVAVVNNQGSDMGSGATFRVSTPVPAGNYAISYYQDSGPINPSAPTAATMNVYTIRPNAKFEVCDVMTCITEKQIGTGTTPVRFYPFDYYNNNSYVQEIFTAADLGITAGAYISSLSFQYTFPANSRNVTVYLANTTKASFGGTTAAEWIPGAQLTKVYAGSLFMPTGWVTIPFDTPFEYTGGNIVVAFLNLSAYTGASGDNRYLAHSTAPDNRVLYWTADAAFAGINTPPTATARVTTRNNIIFNLCMETPPVDMAAMSITGATMLPALVQSTYAVTVKNFGALVAKNFTVNVLNAANAVLGTATVTAPLASGASTVVDVTFAFPTTMVGNQNIKGQVIAGCDANAANNETPLFAVNVLSECTEMAGYSNIGTATTIGTTYNSIPFNFYYGNGVAQTIYLESELGFAPGTPIKKLTYKYNATIAVPEKPIKVYLTHTTLTNFGTGTATAANFIPTNTFTMVFDGQFSTAIGNNQELVINFDEPFIYQGGNLCIMTHREFVTASQFYSYVYWLVSDVPTNRTVRYYSDAAPFNFTNPGASTGSWAFNAAIPNVTIGEIGTKEFTFDYSITGDGIVNVALNPDPFVCSETGFATVTITPDPCTAITAIKFDGITQTIQTSYTFPGNLPLPEIEIVANIIKYNIVATAGLNGSIDPTGTVNAYCGTNQKFDFIPYPGYVVDFYEVDGTVLPKKNSHTFGNLAADHTIHVEFKDAPYTIYFTHEGNGQVIPVGKEALIPFGQIGMDEGDMQLFIFVPDPNNEIQAVYINGVSNPGALISGSYMFVNVHANHNIHVVFKPIDMTIIASAGPNGMIDPQGNVKVPYGSNQEFQIKANTGFVIDQLFVDGEPVTVGDHQQYIYTFYEVEANHTIYVTFKVAIWEIAVSWTDCGNSMLTPAGTGGIVYVPHNTVQIITFVPDEGCKVVEVLVNGESKPASIPTGSYTFYYVTENQTIHVAFANIQYQVKSSINGNGVITPNGTKMVNHGDDQKYTWNVFPGFKVVNVFIDGLNNPAAVAAGEYTFENVKAPHTIDVITAPIVLKISAVAETGGFITPSGDISVGYGQNQMFTFKPASGYAIKQVLVNGIVNAEAAINGAYAFLNVKENHTIKVSFEVMKYFVQAKANSGGIIEPKGITELTYFDEILYTITPEDGYKISYVLVNGDNKGTINTFTFSEVETDGSIEAFFELLEIIGIDPTDNEVSIYSHGNTVYIVNNTLIPLHDVSIIDMYGRVVWQGNVYDKRNTIPLNVATGIYTVRVATEDGFTATKVNIQR